MGKAQLIKYLALQTMTFQAAFMKAISEGDEDAEVSFGILKTVFGGLFSALLEDINNDNTDNLEMILDTFKELNDRLEDNMKSFAKNHVDPGTVDMDAINNLFGDSDTTQKYMGAIGYRKDSTNPESPWKIKK